MEKFPECLPQLGMQLEVAAGKTTMITVWEGSIIVCVGVGKDVPDALRRAEPWFWREMVDRKLAEILTFEG